MVILQKQTAPVWQRLAFPAAWVLRSLWRCASAWLEPSPGSQSEHRIERSPVATAPTAPQKTSKSLDKAILCISLWNKADTHKTQKGKDEEGDG